MVTAVQRRKAEERTRRGEEVLQRLMNSRKGADEIEPEGVEEVKLADVQHGVTTGWLAAVFGLDPSTVKKRLRDCPPIHRRKAGFVYDLKVASQYLVKPVVDIEQYLRTLKTAELPSHLQDSVWSALLKKQKWQENARQLWRTEEVMDVLGDVFQTIKFSMQLWPDTVERMHGLSPEQREMLVAGADALQAELHQKLVSMVGSKQTRSSVTEAPDETPAIDLDDEEDFDVSQLV